jgi:hypothetical protein
MTDTALVTNGQTPKELALLRAVGFDKLSPEQRALALQIADRYELDPLLKHLVMIEGRPYITRDGLLHVAHRSGKLDGIETSEAAIVDGFWRASCSVYRKDMSRPFTYTGRYPTSGGNQKFAPEMAVKVAEVMALRRAFDVAAPVAEERWDIPQGVEVPSASAAQPSLAERAAAKRAELETEDLIPPAGLSRVEFGAALTAAGIAAEYAVERSKTLFPGIEPKALTDPQRAELLADLTRPEEAPTAELFDEAEIDAAVARI